MTDPLTFLVPYDFSPSARAALFAAADLGRRLGADLDLVHVVQPPSYACAYAGPGSAVLPSIHSAEVREAAMASLRGVVDGIEAFPGAIEAHVFEGSGVSDVILESAERLGADLIVMGTHGRTGLAHVFLGSVAERAVRSASCPVLTVQPQDQDEQTPSADVQASRLELARDTSSPTAAGPGDGPPPGRSEHDQ